MDHTSIKSASDTLVESLNEVFWSVGDLIEAVRNASATVELKQRIERQRLEYDAALDTIELHIIQTINALKRSEPAQESPKKEDEGMADVAADGDVDADLGHSGGERELASPGKEAAEGQEEDGEHADVLNPEAVGLFDDDFDFAT